MRIVGAWRRLLGRQAPPPSLVDRLAGPLDELLRVLFQEASAGVLIADRSGRIVRANDTLRRMVSRRVDLTPGQPAIAAFQEAERQAIEAALRTALHGGGLPAPLTARLERGDPDPDHRVDVSGSVLREADRSISGLILRITDLTLQTRLERQLANSQKLQAIGQLAGGIAHDFNNLLTAILAGTDLVLGRTDLDADLREDVGQIRGGAERGAALVRQLLAFGRQQTLQPRVLAINDAIQDIAGLLRRLLGGRISLELDLETPGRLVRVDPTQLDQVLVNLAVNARDAMPGGGRLALRSGHVTLYRPLIRGQETIPPGRYVMVEVEDTGVGIPAEVLPRIFDPFFTTRRESGGTGLGLSTVHGIVRQSDGFLAVESEIGKGTRFRLYLPRHDAAELVTAPPSPKLPPAAVPVSPRPGADRGRTVLLVDDEDMIRGLAERALRQRGWEVLSADSAEAALALLEDRRAESGAPPPAVLVSDVVMPGMDGPALVRAVRATQPDLPAILVSGYADETLRQDCTGPGIVFLSKPYTLKALLAAVDDMTISAAEPATAGLC
ncbi:MAG TPA: ATP-binding protein [Acetobacteraceae bacterium]|nr:ATP-binding protein [Acetobacteraceae bacterium]